MDPIIFIRIIGENPFSAYIPSPDGGIFLSDRILRSLRSFVIDSYEKLSTTPPFRTSASTLIIAKTRCDENQNEMRFFEGVNSPKRNVTKISHAHEKHRSNGIRQPFERCFGLEIL